jgi:acyl-CoA thioesterase FadM
MARAVSAGAEMAGRPTSSVRRVQARFLAPVALDSTIEIHLVGRSDDAASVEVRTDQGELALAGTCWFSEGRSPLPTS